MTDPRREVENFFSLTGPYAVRRPIAMRLAGIQCWCMCGLALKGFVIFMLACAMLYAGLGMPSLGSFIVGCVVLYEAVTIYRALTYRLTDYQRLVRWLDAHRAPE